MSEKKLMIPRATMLPQERKLRSQLAQLLSQQGLLRGSFLLRRRVCGKSPTADVRAARSTRAFL